MAIKFVSVKCPECGASLDVEEGRGQIFCSYCGTKVMVQNENEYIYRHIDEAGMKQAETDRMIKLKQLEINSKASDLRKLLVIVWLIASAVLTALGIIGETLNIEGLDTCLLIAFDVALFGGLVLLATHKKNKPIVVNSDEAAITEAMESCKEKNYNAAAALFRSAGFTNVNTVALNDLNIFTLGKNGKVEEVTINGDSDFEEGDVFSKTADITITYHSAK